MADNVKMKNTVKDSIFTDLFGNPKCLFQLYKSFHSEDESVKEDLYRSIKVNLLKPEL